MTAVGQKQTPLDYPVLIHITRVYGLLPAINENTES
jgi:hypothetical protein